jgi:hypothetical protein
MERYIAKRASLAGLGIGRDLSALSQAAVEKALKVSSACVFQMGMLQAGITSQSVRLAC